MLRVSDVKIDPQSVGEELLLTDISPVNEFVDGVRKDKVIGFRYTVASTEHGLRKLGVKIEGAKQFDDSVLKDFPEVEFKDLEIKVYKTKETIGLTATATGIKLKEKAPKA